MMEYDPVTSLRHFPMPLSHHGLNPYGEPLYRIVFTESRRHLVGGCWPDGEVGYHWVPTYRQIKAFWVLERWKSCLEFAGMSQKQWDRTMIDPVSGWLLLGPYPSRGEYDLAYEFDAPPTVGLVEKLAGALERGRLRSFQDIRDPHAREYEAEERETRQSGRDEMRDSRLAFGMSAFSSLTGVARGIKTMPAPISAEQAGLPIPRPRGDPKRLEATSTLIAGVR